MFEIKSCQHNGDERDFNTSVRSWELVHHVRIQRGQGVRPPLLKNHKNKGFLSNTGLDPLKITKLPSKHSILGHHRQANETSFKWRVDDGPLIVGLFGLDPLSHLKKKNKKKTVVNGPPLTKLSGSAHVHYC